MGWRWGTKWILNHRCTQMHTDRGGYLGDERAPASQDLAFDFDAKPAEIDQQTQAQASRLQVIEALREMNVVLASDRLLFDDDRVLHQKVHNVFADRRAPVLDDGAALLLHRKACITPLERQRILVKILDESWS